MIYDICYQNQDYYMDEMTHQLINHFVTYFQEYLKRKEYKHFQIINWSSVGNRVTLKLIYHDEHKEIFLDLRELKDNESRFSHLVGNLMDQLDTLKYPQ